MYVRQLLMTFIVLAALLVLPLVSVAPAVAQDATPTATCVAPALPPGEPTDPNATPAAMEEEAVAEEAAPVQEGPASRNIAATAREGLDNALACFNAGDYLGTAALFTPGFVMEFTGTGNPYDVAAALEEESDIQITTEVNSVIDTNNRVGIHIIYRNLPVSNGVMHSERWYMVKDGDYWKLDEIAPALSPPDLFTAATVVEINMVDFAFALSQNSVPAGPVILRFTNTSFSGSPHLASLFTVADGVTAEQMIQMDASAEDPTTSFLTETFVEPGQTVEILLSFISPGVYTLFCGFETADGVSHHNLGMVAQFTVEAPA